MTGFAIDDRLGTFADIVAAAPQHRELLGAIRALVAELHPDALESASRKERSVSWGFGEAKRREWYAYAMPHKAHVNLGFFQGIHLPDPEGLLEGTGKALRHVKLRTRADLDRPAVRALLLAAREERAHTLNPEKGDDHALDP